jgi:hypothetical protein
MTQTDQVKAMIPYWCHLLNPLQSVSMKGRSWVKEWFLSFETWIVCVPVRGWIGKIKYWSAFEPGMVVDARHTGLCQELQCCWVFHAQQFPMCIKNSSPPKGHPANLAQLLEALESSASIPVECFRHLIESIPQRIKAVVRESVPNVWYTAHMYTAHIDSIQSLVKVNKPLAQLMFLSIYTT